MIDYRAVERQLTGALGLQRRPVAVAFRSSPPPGVAKFSGTEPSGCSFWRLAAAERTFYTVPADHHNCPIGSYTHNIPLPAERAQDLNQALSLTLNNKIVYVGTFFDNGLVLGFDYTNPARPRLVHQYAHGDFVLTTIDTMLFHGNDLLIGGDLGYAYPFQQVDMTHPFDSINQYFPPLALQNPGAPNALKKHLLDTRKGKRGNPISYGDPRFYRTPATNALRQR
jgi:hypothetical protein